MPQQSALTASWIGSRWGIDPVALEVRRRAGEVFAFREQGSDDWLYPGWQFDDEGNVRPDVARVLAAAREAGIGPSQLAQILNRRSGASYLGRGTSPTTFETEVCPLRLRAIATR